MPGKGRFVRDWPNVRVIVLSPYLIFYRFDEQVDKVEVLRFWHGARDPATLEL
jgi:plasmid stabilization system protein ParE